MPKASAPKAPCVEVWLSPQTIVRPGWVTPCSGPITCTMPWRVSKIPYSSSPNSRQLSDITWICVAESGSGFGWSRPIVGTLWVDGRERQVRAAHRAAGQPQPLEGLRRGHLVHEVQVDVEQVGLRTRVRLGAERLAARSVGERAIDDVRVPDLLGQRARFGHPCPRLVQRRPLYEPTLDCRSALVPVPLPEGEG